LLLNDAPLWATDSHKVWNEVEKIEKRKDAQLFREINVALPRELTHEDNKSLVLDYCNRNFINHGMVASIAFHSSKSENPHAHIMLTTRHINENGFQGKAREWNDKIHLQEWRKDWAETVNNSLTINDKSTNIDHRSLINQGLTQKPTIHLGKVAHAMEQRGESSERGNDNREISWQNKQLLNNEKSMNQGIEDARGLYEQQKQIEKEQQIKAQQEKLRQRQIENEKRWKEQQQEVQSTQIKGMRHGL
jgi:hypothetical protein